MKPNKKDYGVAGDIEYINKKGKEKTAFDLSGIACLPKDDGMRRCLVVNDEGNEAQFVEIEGHTIRPKEQIPLLNGAAEHGTRGSVPTTIGCPGGRSDDVEFDGEGVAYSDGYFYVAGSHSCGRKHGEFKPSAMVLTRIRVDGTGRLDGKPDEAIETTFRLGEAFAKAETVGAFSLKSLKDSSNGLNLEGVAVIGKQLFAGLRAPSLDGKAYLVSVPVDALFAPDWKPPLLDPKVIPLAIGMGTGIRDLGAFDERRLLVLTGPAQEQLDVASKLFIADVTGAAEPQLLGHLDSLEDAERCGKAEAAMVIGKNRVLVLFDGLKNGGPREYDVDLPPRR